MAQPIFQSNPSTTFQHKGLASLEHHHQENPYSGIQYMDPYMRATLEARLANIEQRTQQIIHFANISSSFS